MADDADRYVTHSHLHWHPGKKLGGDSNAKPVIAPSDHHGHWHKHDARNREDHAHQHGIPADLWPHDGALVEQLPPPLPKKSDAPTPIKGKRKPVPA